jgi:hypothetical protein
MYCTKCGADNDERATRCTMCGDPLSKQAQPAPPVASDTVSSVIPYRNPQALIAYYLGVFSIIPFIGALLGIVGFVLGIMGLRHAARHPEAKGRVHAWVGIIAGGIFGFGWLGIIILMAVNIGLH